MILNKDLIATRLNRIAEGRGYLVLDTEVFLYSDHRKNFEYAVEVLGVINWINPHILNP